MTTSDHEPKIREKKFMRKYLIGAVLVGAFATPAFAYFVGLNTTTHTCSVVTKMEAGMKMMGKYKTKAAAEKAMAGMAECKDLGMNAGRARPKRPFPVHFLPSSFG